ncbi:radical SAM protein [Clostridiaceae bacterium M8S5]|nr:radical SAM protein [Clostridiaceae bacterium M8S5]
MTDVLLINSIDFVYEKKLPNIGQLILRDILQDKYKVEYVNFDYLNYTKELQYKSSAKENIKQFTDYILNKKPKIVGFYTICNSFYVTIKIAEAIKSINKDIKIVFGGPHATMTAETCLENFSFIDVICLGESEKTILKLVNKLMKNEDLKKTPGIVYRYGGSTIVNKPCELLTNEELVNYNVYNYKPFEFSKNDRIELEVGRGCPFSCTFCSTSMFWGRKFRIKPVREIINQMVKINRIYNVKKFSLIHDMFTVNKQTVHAFCNILLSEKLEFEWTCSSRIDALDEETILLMHRANCKGMFLGIETGSRKMQKTINKCLDLDDVQNLISIIVKTGIDVTVSFIYGFPYETIQDFKETIKIMEEIRRLGVTDIQLHRFMVLPQTVDTNKIKNKVYFDQSDVNISIYNTRIYDDEAIDFIKRYPEAFIQYHTFSSEVRRQYKRFDFFHSTVMSAMSIFDCSIDYILKKIGWELLYEKYINKIEKMFKIQQSYRINQVTDKYRFISESCKFIKEILEDVAYYDKSDYFSNILKFEKIFFEFCEEKKKESEYYHFRFNVLEAKRKRVLIYDSVYVKFVYLDFEPRIMQYKKKKVSSNNS